MDTITTRTPDIAERELPQAFGLTKPVGHTMVALPPGGDASALRQALVQAGVDDHDIIVVPADEFARRSGEEIAKADALASLGKDLDLVKEHHGLAVRGHDFIVVRTPHLEDAQRVGAVAERHGATLAQRYGRFAIEEMIDGVIGGRGAPVDGSRPV